MKLSCNTLVILQFQLVILKGTLSFTCQTFCLLELSEKIITFYGFLILLFLTLEVLRRMILILVKFFVLFHLLFFFLNAHYYFSAEELVNPEICEPGCYKASCIELDLVGLAVNTVLEANKINEIEGGSNFLNFDLNPTVEDSMNKAITSMKSFDETTASVRAFRILKALITEWSCDVGKTSIQMNENSLSSADLFIAHFYRWVSNPHSRLYDPSLHRTLHSLMKKVFWQLIAELRKVGATIVYANFNKV